MTNWYTQCFKLHLWMHVLYFSLSLLALASDSWWTVNYRRTLRKQQITSRMSVPIGHLETNSLSLWLLLLSYKYFSYVLIAMFIDTYIHNNLSKCKLCICLLMKLFKNLFVNNEKRINIDILLCFHSRYYRLFKNKILNEYQKNCKILQQLFYNTF